MEFQISKVSLPKEIDWEDARSCKELYVEMMRNRIVIEASATFETCNVSRDDEVMFHDFMEDPRKFLDGNNVGLYAFKVSETHTMNNCIVRYDRETYHGECNSAKGTVTIFFEDHGDYARFLKERAVMFKLSVV